MPLLIFVVGLGLGLILGAFLGGIRTFTLTLDYEVTDRRSNSGEGKPAEEGAGGNVGQPSGSSDLTGGSGEFTGTAAGNLNGPGVTDPRTATSNEATIGGMPSPPTVGGSNPSLPGGSNPGAAGGDSLSPPGGDNPRGGSSSVGGPPEGSVGGAGSTTGSADGNGNGPANSSNSSARPNRSP